MLEDVEVLVDPVTDGLHIFEGFGAASRREAFGYGGEQYHARGDEAVAGHHVAVALAYGARVGTGFGDDWLGLW